MGYRVKLQKVERPTNRSYYLNVPVALAEAIELRKGEELEWFLQDQNTLVVQRTTPRKPKYPKRAVR